MNLQRKKTRQTIMLTVIGVAMAGNSTVYANSTASVTDDIVNAVIIGRDDEQIQQSEYESYSMVPQDSSANVYATREAAYNISIPKTIVLSGSANGINSGEYTISVTGDLSGTQTITVCPDSNDSIINGGGKTLDAQKTQFYLGQTGKEDIVATVNQAKTVWTWDDVVSADKSSVTGTVVATDMTAGTWGGYFNFKVTVDSLNPVSGTNSYTINFGQTIPDVTIIAIDESNSRHKGVISADRMSVTFEQLKANTSYTISVSGDVDGVMGQLNSFTTSAKEGISESVTPTQIDEWDYVITTYNGEKVVKLKAYKGSKTDIIIPSKYTVDGVTYQTVFAKSGYTSTSQGTVHGMAGIIYPTGTYGPFIENSKITSITFEDGCIVEDNDMTLMFYECTNLKKVTNIPKDVTIMHNTFFSCISLEELPVIPSGVTTLEGCFIICLSLTEIDGFVIPDGCTTVKYLFDSSVNIERVNNLIVPASVKDISYILCRGSKMVGSITIDGSPSTSYNAFYQVKNTLSVNYTDKCTNIDAIMSSGNANGSASKGSLVTIQ